MGPANDYTKAEQIIDLSPPPANLNQIRISEIDISLLLNPQNDDSAKDST